MLANIILMKEIIIDKSEIVKVFIYDKGKLLETYELKINKNDYPCINKTK